MCYRHPCGPRQSSKLSRGHRRWNGCCNRILGQFPKNLELNIYLNFVNRQRSFLQNRVWSMVNNVWWNSFHFSRTQTSDPVFQFKRDLIKYCIEILPLQFEGSQQIILSYIFSTYSILNPNTLLTYLRVLLYWSLLL